MGGGGGGGGGGTWPIRAPLDPPLLGIFFLYLKNLAHAFRIKMFSVRHKKIVYFQTITKESLLKKQTMYVSDNSVLHAPDLCIILLLLFIPE